MLPPSWNADVMLATKQILEASVAQIENTLCKLSLQPKNNVKIEELYLNVYW